MRAKDWDDSYLQYTDTFKLLKKTRDDNVAILNALREYLISYKRRLEDFVAQAKGRAPPTASILVAQSIIAKSASAGAAAAAAVKPAVSSDSVDMKSFDDIQNFGIAQFRTSTQDLQQFVLGPLMTFETEYTSRMDVMLGKLKDALAAVNDARSRFYDAYQQYVMMRTTVIQAYNTKSPTLATAKASFVTAQTAAAQTLTKMNDVTLQTTRYWDVGLTEYETIEQWRTQTLKECIEKMGLWCQGIATILEQAVGDISNFARFVPSDAVLGEIMDCSLLRRPDADDGFQVIPIDPRVTMFLDKTAMYVDLQKKGMKLYKAQKNVVGTGSGLSVSTGEVVCALEVGPAEITAVNINGSKGKLDLAAVAPFE
jgi:hypothetical protein